jgi:hypothetical protein
MSEVAQFSVSLDKNRIELAVAVAHDRGVHLIGPLIAWRCRSRSWSSLSRWWSSRKLPERSIVASRLRTSRAIPAGHLQRGSRHGIIPWMGGWWRPTMGG